LSTPSIIVGTLGQKSLGLNCLDYVAKKIYKKYKKRALVQKQPDHLEILAPRGQDRQTRQYRHRHRHTDIDTDLGKKTLHRVKAQIGTRIDRDMDERISTSKNTNANTRTQAHTYNRLHTRRH